MTANRDGDGTGRMEKVALRTRDRVWYDLHPVGAERDRRWRTIVATYCVLDTPSEADAVAARLLAAGVQRVLEVGSHRGPLAERLAPWGVTTICVELDTADVRLAHQPAVQATATHLPFADASADAVAGAR